MARKRRFPKFHQGTYKPKNTHKYIGRGTPRYLSGWELRFFRWCDDNDNVIKWASENVIIPYVNPLDGKAHKYMVDNLVVIKEGKTLTKYLIEIKPKKQTRKPTTHGNKKKSTILYENIEYVRNQAKWNSAREWCKKHGYKFQILTEDDLFR
tara:strand:+ start:219 stop:674 length:456 start_codon:yes stop_codon:yes gene_type:complete